MKKFVLFSVIGFILVTQQSNAGGIEEGFENVNELQNQGWTFENRSDFIGDLSWSQGSAKLFAAQAGPEDSYILGGSGQTAGNVLCDWLILPAIGHVDQLNFFTRTASNSIAADRLVVAYSASGSTNTGPCLADAPNGLGTTDFGDFTVIYSVNPGLTAGAYPEQWTEINVPVNGNGRLALVYFVENVSQTPFNGNLVAIDSINIGPASPQGSTTAVPGLGIWSLLALAIFMLVVTVWHAKKQKA